MTDDKAIKLHVSADVTNKLKVLKARSGLAPNILCRLGLGLSLDEAGVPNPDIYPTDGAEFNRYTLLGQYDLLITSLVKERCRKDGLDIEANIGQQLRAHLNRGIYLLYSRLKTLNDLENMLPKELKPKSTVS